MCPLELQRYIPVIGSIGSPAFLDDPPKTTYYSKVSQRHEYKAKLSVDSDISHDIFKGYVGNT